MPDQLFTARAKEGVAPLTFLASDRGWRPLPRDAPLFPASGLQDPEADVGAGRPAFSGEPRARHLLAEGVACHVRVF